MVASKPRRAPLSSRQGRLLAGLVALAAAHADAATLPTRTTITVDGSFADWTEVLTNPVNFGRDGLSTPQCMSSTDRDCGLVDASSRDLARLAWTWDATSLYLMLERDQHGAGTDYAFVYLDIDDDDRMEAHDWILRLRLTGGTKIASADLFACDPAGAVDPMLDGAGFADGFIIASQTSGAGSALAPAMSNSNGGKRVEVAVPWSALGVAAGKALSLHASTASGSAIPGTVVDNMAGPGGGAASTAFRDLALDAPILASVVAGGVAPLAHVVTNTGNLAGVIELHGMSVNGYPLEWRADRDGDGVAETFLGLDRTGDGVLTDLGDVLDAAGDSDGDTILDLGLLADGQRVAFQVLVGVPASESGATDSIVVTASHVADRTVTARVTDTVRVGDVTLATNEVKLGLPGQLVWLSHVVQNNFATDAAIGFSASTWDRWSVALFDDPNQDGDPSDAAPMPDTDADGAPDMLLAGGASRRLLVRVAVPASETAGSTQFLWVRALLDGTPAASVFDQIVLAQAITVAPSYLRSDGNARHGAAGASIYFPHVLTNALTDTTSFDLTAASDLGWPVVVLTDPNADGRPFDSAPLVGPLAAASNGGRSAFIVRVDVPPGTGVGEVSRVKVTAVASNNPSMAMSADDDAVSALVRVHEDPARLVSVDRLPWCGTGYTAATNLQPSSGGYRFQWKDALGTLVRETPVTTSPSGDCVDDLALMPSDAGAGWTVSIQWLDAGGWLTLDTAPFSIGDGLVADGLATERAAYDVSATSVTATLDVANADFDQPVSAVPLRWAILSANRSRYLMGDGSWAPWTGAEATRVDVVSLAPGVRTLLTLQVGAINFASAADLPIEIWRGTGCAAETLLATGTLRIVNDADGDSLSHSEELAAGTDPSDADSDDDGVLDDADGLSDTDADGVIDALDCDSDDDGLADGLETGVTLPPSSTDSASGCFAADSDPLTVTDPDAEDTDGGGVFDGDEDVDRDGAVDPGERDPGDAADDLALPPDLDLDDDGVANADEIAAGTDPNACDTDGDGLADGLELGLTSPHADTDPASACFVADADPSTTTDPRVADTDGGGAPDGDEDADGDGAVGTGETDPNDSSDDVPIVVDLDLDDDGVTNADEARAGTDPLDCDSDDDGLADGLELGLAAPVPDTDPAAACFAPDADPSTTTNPLAADSDAGGAPDGDEDADRDGEVDPGERNPGLGPDDACAPAGRVTDLRVTHQGDTALLAWTGSPDACTTYTVEASEALPAMRTFGIGVTASSLTDATPLSATKLRCYRVVAVSSIWGAGPVD